MDIKIKSLLDECCVFSSDGTFSAFVAHCAFPITVVQPGETLIYRSHEAFTADLCASYAPLWDAGLSSIKYTVLSQSQLGPVVISLDVQWDYLDAQGSVIWLDYVTYILRRWPSRLEVVSYIDHSRKAWVAAHAG